MGEIEKHIAKVKKDLEYCIRSSISQDQVNKEHVLRYKLEKLET